MAGHTLETLCERCSLPVRFVEEAHLTEEGVEHRVCPEPYVFGDDGEPCGYFYPVGREVS